ncbi:MAG: PEP-CTERM sorting domain-containing protein [Cyanobacteria bacterium RI_101]|nr:PEP-CTERM sorting domain-containing protein [Cyanobacteria bacterium RI_101]
MLSKLLVKIALGVGIPLGSLSLGVMPGAAGIVPLLNPTIGGTNPTDFFLRCANTTPGVSVPAGDVLPCPNPTDLGFVDEVLQGGPVPPPGNPGGNVELAFSSEVGGFDFTKFTSLEGTILGKNFFARSLVSDDWSANNNALTKQFLTDALVANNFNPIFLTPAVFDPLVSAFISLGGPQRFSDPNITYVFADDQTGDLTVGLAGLLNSSQLLKQFFTGSIPPELIALIPDVVQVSEVVYLDYYPGKAGYFYSFAAANSGQSSDDQGAIPGCNGGAPSGVNDFLANCSYSGDFQVSQIVGNTPNNPVLPGGTTPDGGFLFPNFPVFDTNQTIWFDPPVDNYEFEVLSGPLFTSVNLPPGLGGGAGNNFYDIFLDDGGSCDNFVTSIGTAESGIPFAFPGAVPCFAVTGLTSLQSGDPFVVGLTFDSTGLVTLTKTPQVVPEPMTLLGAAVAMGFGAQFKRKRSNSQDK